MSADNFLAQQVSVLQTELKVTQREFNQVLNDVQVAMQGMSRGTKMALEVFDSRIRELENKLKLLDQSTEEKPVARETGIEL